jgi:hypothetical protein
MKFFGEKDKSPCDQGCDYCADPDAVCTAFHQLEESYFSHLHPNSKTMAISASRIPDPTLYGGGRYGEDCMIGSYDDDSDNDSKCSTARDQAEVKKFFAAQFKLRRQLMELKDDKKAEKPGPDCRLIDAMSTHIAGLSWKVRDHCLALIEKTLVSTGVTTS